jgi:hypothetical protein
VRRVRTCVQGPTPMATGGGRGRSYAGKARFFPCAPASVAEVSQGREGLKVDRFVRATR